MTWAEEKAREVCSRSGTATESELVERAIREMLERCADPVAEVGASSAIGRVVEAVGRLAVGSHGEAGEHIAAASGGEFERGYRAAAEACIAAIDGLATPDTHGSG